MPSLFISILALCGVSVGAAIIPPEFSKRAGAPPSSINVESADYICDVTSDLPVVRDLGFVGKIQDTIIYTYGDTESNTTSFYMTSDSSAIGTDSPCHVLNTQRTSDGQHPDNFIEPETYWQETNTQDAFGGTNVLPTVGNDGMMFYLKNNRPIGGTSYVVGAGVARVSLDGENITTARLAANWWDAARGEPWYGDIGAYRDHDTLYGFGHGGPNDQYAYLTRANVDNWDDFSNWEYFDGSTNEWSNNRLYHPTSDQAIQWNYQEGPVWGVDQGQMVWSEYFQKVLWVYSLNWGNGDNTITIYGRLADGPQGPWSAATKLYTAKKLNYADQVYCAVVNPFYDTSGKTVIVTVDNGSRHIQATKVTFA